jgi:predicted HD superfamily hydrolase involved in NAD metabolism
LHESLRHLAAGVILTGNLSADVPAFLHHHGCPKTAVHSADVAAAARRVALATGADPDQAEAAGWLHDISAVVPPRDRAEVARQWGLEVLPEEDAFPLIAHQKLSVVIARDLLGVTDEAVLSAVGCHTTLRAGATLLDRVLFVADKIAWDQQGRPPYLTNLVAALARSLDDAARCYLTWMQNQPLKVVHPWLRGAYEELTGLAWREIMHTIRDARPEDYAAIAAIVNQIDPEPITAEGLHGRDQHLQQEENVILRRIVAEDRTGALAGYGVAVSVTEDPAEHRWYAYAAVAQTHRGRGAGAALARFLEQFAAENGASFLNTRTNGGDEASFAWAERRGFALLRQRTESVLDLTAWDPARFANQLDRVRASGLQLVTLRTIPESMYQELYDTDVETTKDHPEYDGNDQSYENFLRSVSDERRPLIWALALDGERIAGYSVLRLPEAPGGGAYTDYTCVRRAYRGRGVSLAVKLLTIEAAREAGVTYMRTNNNPENGPMLAINEKLGYRMVPGPRRLRKKL